MNLLILSRGQHLYSTRRLVSVAQERGHRVDVFDPLEISLELGGPRLGAASGARALNDIDAVIPRIGWTATDFGIAVVKQFELMGAIVVNRALAISRARDKLRCLQLLNRQGIAVPRTVMTRSPEDLRPAIERVGGPPVVLKLLSGAQGVGVMLVESIAAAESVVDAFWGMNQNLLVQEFIEEAAHDLRLFVVGREVLAVMSRWARDGEFRSNLHRGGWGEAAAADPGLLEMARRTTEVIGLDVAGVDVVSSGRGPLVMEVNVSPGLEGIEGITGCDLAGDIVHFAETKHEQAGR